MWALRWQSCVLERKSSSLIATRPIRVAMEVSWIMPSLSPGYSLSALKAITHTKPQVAHAKNPAARSESLKVESLDTLMRP